jgi:outer membrane receptor protein involved in Fe transport
MNRNLILIVLFFLTSYCVQAQTNILAIVVEAETQEPMQYVNVVLLNAQDSTMVDGMVTDDDGEFDFENISSGEYYIKISFIGFEPVELSVSAPPGETDLGLVPITKSSILLDEIEVTGEKSTLVSTLDKKIYNVGKDIISESGSVSDILQNIPSVSVDVNGKVTLRGTSNITFLVNGRPSALLRRNAPVALQQISASTIDRIEVITNPSAKYNPEGTGGIINIIQRKDSEQGVNGQIIGNIGNEKRYNATLILNYGNEDFNSYGSYSLRHSSGTNEFTDDRTNKEPATGNIKNFYNEKGSTEIDPLGHIFDAGITYQFDEQNSIEIAGTYLLQNTMIKGTSNLNIIDDQNQPLTRYRSENNNDELESEGEGGAAYEHIFGENEDHSLVIEAAYASYSERENLTFDEFFTLPNVDYSSQSIFIKKSGNQTELVSEYALPIDKDSEFEAGYLGEFVSDDIFYINNQDRNRFLFDQDIHALYSIYGRDIEDFNFQVGLRAEQVLINSHLIEPTDSLIENDYFKLYPSIHFAYDFTDNENIMLSYSKRVNRPEADHLNPAVELIDPRNGEAGNANLKPEQIHSVELTYQSIGESFTFTPSLYYRFKYDAFTAISKPFGDSLVVSTIENLSNQQSAGLELIFSGKIFKWWDFDLSGNIFYDEIDATDLGFSTNKSDISGMAQLYSLFKITGSTFLQLNLFYNSPILTPQGQREHIFYLNAGLKQTLFNNQLALTFTVSDIFSTYKERLSINSSELIQSTNLYRKDPALYLGASWRFGESFQSDKSDLEFEAEGLRKL